MSKMNSDIGLLLVWSVKRYEIANVNCDSK